MDELLHHSKTTKKRLRRKHNRLNRIDLIGKQEPEDLTIDGSDDSGPKYKREEENIKTNQFFVNVESKNPQ